MTLLRDSIAIMRADLLAARANREMRGVIVAGIGCCVFVLAVALLIYGFAPDLNDMAGRLR